MKKIVLNIFLTLTVFTLKDEVVFAKRKYSSKKYYSTKVDTNINMNYTKNERNYSKVFVTSKGKKYHISRGCKTLARSKNIFEIDISKVGSRGACKVCS